MYDNGFCLFTQNCWHKCNFENWIKLINSQLSLIAVRLIEEQKLKDNVDEDDDDDDDDIQAENDGQNKLIDSTLAKTPHESCTSGMFPEFEDQAILSGNNQSCDEPMDTTNVGQILAKVPAGTSVSTTIVNEPLVKSENFPPAGIFYL